MASIQELKDISSQVRRDIVRMVHACQSGHPGGSLGCADYFVAMYFYIMNHSSSFNSGLGEDLFFLSNGHVSPVWYSTLARSGYFEVSELKPKFLPYSMNSSRLPVFKFLVWLYLRLPVKPSGKQMLCVALLN